MYLLGLDIGTTSCKAMLFTIDGKVLGRAYEEYSVIFNNGLRSRTLNICGVRQRT